MSQSVFEIITNKIIEKLKIGVVPWEITWSNGLAMPRNGVSKKLYRGINFFLLLLEGFDSPYWYTFNQVNALGGRIKKGEKSSIIVFWHMLEKEDEKNVGKKIKVPILRFYKVFNALQCEGISPEAVENEQNKIKECEEIVSDYIKRESNLKIQNYRLNAFYSPASDLINVPPIDKFDGKENYYLTYFHELVHSTGHESRLDRGFNEVRPFGSEDYSKEELVAELGAAFLAGLSGIDSKTEDSSASYLNGWIEALKGDPKLLIKAGSQAQAAVDLIIGKETEKVSAFEETFS